MNRDKLNFKRILQERGYLPHHRFDYIYRLSKENPSWAVIGHDGITSEEYKFVLANSRKKYGNPQFELNEPTRLENVETRPFL